MRLFNTLSFGVAALALAGMVAPGRALAEADAGAPRWKTTVKAGTFLPSQGTMRDLSTAAWYFVGVDVDPGFRYQPRGGTVTLAAEVAFRDRNDATFFTAPLLAKCAWDLPTGGEQTALYWGLGAGTYISNTAFRGMVAKPGLQLLLGAKLSEATRLEAAYDYVGRYTDNAGNGISQNGFKLSLGVRL